MGDTIGDGRWSEMRRIDLPDDDALAVLFAHPAYRLSRAFGDLDTNIRHSQAWTMEECRRSIPDADIAVLSGFWDPDLLENAARMKMIHVCAAGYDQFDLEMLERRGIVLTNSRGAMANAVAEHAMAMILAFTRKLHLLRDAQGERHWRPPITEPGDREDELGGKTVLVYGLGTIGSRFAVLAKAFGMRVLGIKRDTANHDGVADEVHPPGAFGDLLPGADYVVLACALNAQTEGLINRGMLDLMSRHAVLVNVARGRCVDEGDLIDGLNRDAIAGAALDCTEVEPLPPESELWSMPNVIVTPHSAGDTRRYERNVVEILSGNIRKIRRGERLDNQIV